MSGDARDFNNIETRAVMNSFVYLQGKALKNIHSILTITLGENPPSYATVKNCVVRVSGSDFSTSIAPLHSTVTAPGDYCSNSRGNLGRPSETG
jgi:hypothetical protein